MRDERLREAKATIREWFRQRDTGYMTRVVDECRDGVFCFSDGCHCLIGLLFENPSSSLYLEWKTANAIRTDGWSTPQVPAELALIALQCDGRKDQHPEATRRVRVLAMALAEIRRRHRVPTAPPVEVACE